MNTCKKVLVSAMIALLTLLPTQTIIAQAANATTKKSSDTVLHIKFAESDEVALNNNEFVSAKGKDLSQVNALLNSNKVAKKSRLFTADPTQVKAQKNKLRATSNTYVPDLNNYYRVSLRPNVNINDVTRDLKQLPSLISEAYAEPLPVKSPAKPPKPLPVESPASADYTGMQSHFSAAPVGMGAAAASSYPGALGDNIRIADLEYSWNTAHEDLSDTRQSDSRINNGTPVDPWNDTNHGTAVAGLLNGDKNSYGINGIIPNSKLHLVNTNSSEYGWNVANAVNTAQSKLVAGDVILIEQQTWGPDGRGYVPVEWVPAAYDAIKVATAKGIIVVEPAANGSENLDDPIYGTTFPQGKADSGAIIVGAGTACNGTTQHSRMSFSNYGKRVNVQGYGECVYTTGYGSLYSAAGVNAWYANGFNGTSSASALVAGIAGSVSSSYESQKGVNLTSVQLRDLLIRYGGAQDMTVAGNIGPLPNLETTLKSFSAVTSTDTIAPTTPTNLAASLTTQNKVSLSWNASSDNSGSVTYQIYRNNVLIAKTTNPNYVDTTVVKGTTYSYKISAVDPTGNVSPYSNIVSIKTSKR